ncbi:MAG: protein kinase family protein, partial [Thaumarchaeota archaeon]|nr:protein kinase family protein [Nitrososphaerota archaeon]
MALRTRSGHISITSDRTLYRYIVKHQLGGGGFGEVVHAHLSNLGIDVAMKRFRRTAGRTEAVTSNWAKEYFTHEGLSHPNILQVYDAFEDDGHLYIVTELASDSVDRRLGFLWPDSVVARAGMQIASALHYMHTGSSGGPLVHRDVTPQNIFYFEGQGIFKIGDFGISKRLEDPDTIAVTQVANWGYVAPELAGPMGYTVPQSDLFQLGLVLYSMTANEHAIDQSLSLREKKQAILSGSAYQRAEELLFTG